MKTQSGELISIDSSVVFGDFRLTDMGKHVRYSYLRFRTDEKFGWRFSDCSESSIEDILDSLNDTIGDVLRNALPRVSMVKQN